jgi:HD-GYP domain-containing protein (c-di-GMP phosphodiesterase class II)
VEGDDGLRALGERLRSAIGDRAFSVGGRTHPLTLSVGAAAAHTAEESGDALLDAADRALYSGKRRGRNQVRLFADLGSEDLALQEPEPLRVAQALALSVAVREGSDPLHSHQVADLSMKLARELGLPPAAIIRCQLAGWLHDAGKVALPDDILRKPGPLDPEQWEIVRNHPLIGEQLVRRIAGLADAAPVIRHHHERYDGTGYPDGLVGDQTPVEARVLAIANAYAAITADRVYAAGVPQDQALEAIEAEAGRQFDPSIARLLRRVIEADRSRVEAVISDDDRLAC